MALWAICPNERKVVDEKTGTRIRRCCNSSVRVGVGDGPVANNPEVIMEASDTASGSAFDTQARRPGATKMAPILAAYLLCCLSATAGQALTAAGKSSHAQDPAASLPVVASITGASGLQAVPQGDLDQEDEEEDCS